VRLRAKNPAGLSPLGPAAWGVPAALNPPPSLIRGDGALSAGWAAEEGLDYEVWYGPADEAEPAAQWTGAISRSGLAAGAVITGLANGTAYAVRVRALDGGTPGGPGEEAVETPEAAPAAAEGFAYVPGGTVGGSGGYAFTVTVPDDPAYNNPGASSLQKGVFVEGRRVRLDSLLMAKYETTGELWFAVQEWALGRGYHFQNRKAAPSAETGGKPVASITWRDALVWCNAYSEMAGLEPVYYYPAVGAANILRDSRNENAAACDNAVMDKAKNGFRLPTEAEREFAARGGDPGRPDWLFRYSGGDDADAVAWYHGNSPYQVQQAGGKRPNRLGLFDLSGNVQEWCWDWMNYGVNVSADTPDDGAAYRKTAPLANQKPFNGGGAGSNITLSCVSYRWGYLPDYKDAYIGFRVVRKP
jgi:formylglycine-generating enzyme required for sulfatase activity